MHNDFHSPVLAESKFQNTNVGGNGKKFFGKEQGRIDVPEEIHIGSSTSTTHTQNITKQHDFM